jgi:hypothetical protein
MVASGQSGFARSRAIVGGLVVGLALFGTSCGGREEGATALEKGCEPSGEDLLAEALAFERELVIRGRADAEFEGEFGDESESLLDEADGQRAALIEQVAAELGLELPAPTAESSCPTPTPGVLRDALSVNVQLAFGVTARALVDAASAVPAAGVMTSAPATSTSTGTAADGSPSLTVTTFNFMSNVVASRATVTTTMRTEVTTGSGSTTESAFVVATIDVCPDPGGLSRGSVTVVLDGATGNGSTYHVDSTQSFDFVVNDQAEVVSTELTCALTYNATGGREARANATGSFSGDSNTFNGGEVTQLTDGSPESEALIRRNLMSFGLSTAGLVRSEARSKWRGGTCIEVDGSPATAMVERDSVTDVTATVRHKFDESNVDAPVVATFSGVRSIDKVGQRVPSPATYRFVAGSEYLDQGVIKFKSTSRRGIGEGTSTLTVKCDEEMPCPERKVLDLETCECVCAEVMACSAGQVWDPETCECVCEEEPCGADERWDTQSCECICDRTCLMGEVLKPGTCECEATCAIDPMYGNTSPECVWVGTITIAGNDTGTVDESTMDYDRTITWSLSYDASLTIQDDGLTVPTVDGTVSGNWDLTDVTTYETLGCSSTVTESAAVSANLVGAGTAYVIPRGDGTLILNVLLPTQTNLTGMTTYQGTGDCGGGDPSELVLRAPEYIGSGTPSASTFSGSEAVDHSYFYLPTREYPELVMSWSLRLVRR